MAGSLTLSLGTEVTPKPSLTRCPGPHVTWTRHLKISRDRCWERATVTRLESTSNSHPPSLANLAVIAWRKAIYLHISKIYRYTQMNSSYFSDFFVAAPRGHSTPAQPTAGRSTGPMELRWEGEDGEEERQFVLRGDLEGLEPSGPPFVCSFKL